MVFAASAAHSVYCCLNFTKSLCFGHLSSSYSLCNYLTQHALFITEMKVGD